MNSKSKASSLKWAIDELSKQREDLDAKLKIALKRDETNSLIEEVFAQKKALEQRISALEDGLRVSSELVDIPCSDLESEMSKIDEKLEIAKERLQAIEQEEYLEELGKKLNRAHGSPTEDSSAQSDQIGGESDISIARRIRITLENVCFHWILEILVRGFKFCCLILTVNHFNYYRQHLANESNIQPYPKPRS